VKNREREKRKISSRWRKKWHPDGIHILIFNMGSNNGLFPYKKNAEPREREIIGEVSWRRKEDLVHRLRISCVSSQEKQCLMC
jgi:hypothetical protein